MMDGSPYVPTEVPDIDCSLSVAMNSDDKSVIIKLVADKMSRLRVSETDEKGKASVITLDNVSIPMVVVKLMGCSISVVEAIKVTGNDKDAILVVDSNSLPIDVEGDDVVGNGSDDNGNSLSSEFDSRESDLDIL